MGDLAEADACRSGTCTLDCPRKDRNEPCKICCNFIFILDLLERSVMKSLCPPCIQIVSTRGTFQRVA
jgi:hypothetical protein